MSSVVNLKIQGRSYALRSHEPEEQIHKVVTFVEQKIAETAKDRSVDSVDLMILTLLNLAGEHLRLREQGQSEERELDVRLKSMQTSIQAALDDNFGC